MIEAVVEHPDIKRDLYSRLDGKMKPDAIVSSNTSGILRRILVEKRGVDFDRRFFVTHFFNPPRHMRLVEVVAGADADVVALNGLARFLEVTLGRVVVRAKDTPGFIANRIGVFHAMDVVNFVSEGGWSIEAVDAVLGETCARPKGGMFKTIDIVGLDTLAVVAGVIARACPGDESVSRFRVPAYMEAMLRNGWTGRKAGKGFYFKDPKSDRALVFDPKIGGYRPVTKFTAPSLEVAGGIDDPGERVRRILSVDDEAGEIARSVISNLVSYAARRIPEVADDAASVDLAMRWGYNWGLGPFALAKCLETVPAF